MPSSRPGRIFGWSVFIVAVVYPVFQIGQLAGHMQWDMDL